MSFSEFRGNPQIVTALRGALKTGRVPHALLFTGPRGVGKYTLTRLFAQAANCERLADDACGRSDSDYRRASGESGREGRETVPAASHPPAR